MNNKTKYKKNIIKSDERVIDVLNKLDRLDIKTLFVNHNSRYLGSITDGDIRRGLLKKFALEDPIKNFTNKNSRTINYSDYISKNYNNIAGLDLIPVIKSGKIFDLIINEKLDHSSNYQASIKELCEVVIMAGGKGTRMQPLTNLIPKPLIPYKDKTLIEHVMHNFAKFQKSDFIVSVNYKADLIIDHLSKNEAISVKKYLYEDFPMGTIGAVHQLENEVDKPIFICNCDSLININFHNMYEFHNKNNFDFTIAACKDIIDIPYGVCAINEDFSLASMTEKPQINHLINSGLYLINNNVLKIIPKNKKFNATDLISECSNHGLSVGVYPFSKESWLDIGLLSDYLAIL